MNVKDRKPWMKFRPDRWLNDEELSLCSLAAQGLWIWCIARMHLSSEYGYLMVGPRAATEKDIAKLVGEDVTLIGTLIGELEANGVLSRREGDNCIYSRRMIRDFEASERGREDVKKRWKNSDKGTGDDTPNRGPIRDPISQNKNKSKSKSKTPPLPPSGEGGSDDDAIPFGPKAEPKPASKPPSPPKPMSARRNVVTLPDDWAARDDERDVARRELKLTAAEFADAEAEFREWAGLNGRRMRAGSQPNWHIAFRNHLRAFAARLRSTYRRETPALYADAQTVRESAKRVAEAPPWWRDVEAQFRDHEFYSGDWLDWRACDPVSADDGECVVRAANVARFTILTQSKAAREKFAEVTGLRVTVLAPEPQRAMVR